MTDSNWELRYNRKSRTGRDRWEVIFDLKFLTSIIEKLEKLKDTNCTDGNAWFTTPHGNLDSADLSYATANTAYIELSKMTEKDDNCSDKQIDEIINLLQSGGAE